MKVVLYSHLFKNFPACCDLHKGFSIVSEAVDIFLEFCCFFYAPVDVGSLISGSSAFSKSNLYIWKFSVYVLLKCSLKDFEHNFGWHVKWVQLCSSLSILPDVNSIFDLQQIPKMQANLESHPIFDLYPNIKSIS